MRGEALREAIRVVVDTFGSDAQHFVFLGSCVLGLYARPVGAPFRATKDVDCISDRKPWAVQQGILNDMVARKTLEPDPAVACRYAIHGTDVQVDVLSPEGMNVPTTAFFGVAADHAQNYDAGKGVRVRAVTPAYFLALKLEALCDRAKDLESATDMEDIVALAVEVPRTRIAHTLGA